MIYAKSKYARLEGTKVLYDVCGTVATAQFESQGDALSFFLTLHSATGD